LQPDFITHKKMIKQVSALLVTFMLLHSCLADMDPLPDTIDTYHYYYNNLMEEYDLQWEVDDALIGNGHSYGIPARATVSLTEPEQEVQIRAFNSENSLLIDSLSYRMFESFSYVIALMGTSENPHLLCEAMDTRMPSAGMVKLRFLHTAEALGDVDIYIGGSEAEHLAFTAMEYAHLSEYQETSEEQIWTSVIVTPANMLPADSTILEYTANRIFRTGGVYLCILEHESSSIESSFQIQAHDQAVY
jgi:hypothetical protein